MITQWRQEVGWKRRCPRSGGGFSAHIEREEESVEGAVGRAMH